MLSIRMFMMFDLAPKETLHVHQGWLDEVFFKLLEPNEDELSVSKHPTLNIHGTSKWILTSRSR